MHAKPSDVESLRFWKVASSLVHKVEKNLNAFCRYGSPVEKWKNALTAFVQYQDTIIRRAGTEIIDPNDRTSLRDVARDLQASERTIQGVA